MTSTDDLVAQAERLARELWGPDAWVHVSSAGELSKYPLARGTYSAYAHRSNAQGDLTSISADYLPTREAAIRTLCAALGEALRAAADADQVAMATCGAKGVDAQGSEVSHDRS